MQDRVRGINSTTQAREDNGNHKKTRLASIVTQVDLERCVSFIEKVRNYRFNKIKDRQIRKLDILSNKTKQIMLATIVPITIMIDLPKVGMWLV